MLVVLTVSQLWFGRSEGYQVDISDIGSRKVDKLVVSVLDRQ